MNESTEFLPRKLKQRLQQVAAEKWHGEMRVEFQNGVIHRWSITEYQHVPKEQRPLALPEVVLAGAADVLK